MTKDVRYAARMLLKTPTFTLVAVVTLALGIGATTAVFSVASAALIRPLPFPSPERLVQFGTMSASDLRDMRAQSRSFDSIATYQAQNKSLQGAPFAERVPVVAGERALFNVLGVSAAIGRTFRPEDGLDVAVVSYGFWQRRLGGDAAVNTTLTLDGRVFTVIGVMAPGFQFPFRAILTDVWIPFELSGMENRARRIDVAVGRLRVGVPFEAARAELQTIASRLDAQYPRGTASGTVPIALLHESIVGRWRAPLFTLLGAVVMVLLISCANVTNLLLVRSEARKHEVAVRTALGATRFRVIRQFLTESILLSAVGTAAALLVAAGGIRMLRVLPAGRIPNVGEIGLDWRVFLFLFGVSILVGIGFGLAPALSASRTNVGGMLHEAGRRQSGTRRSRLVGDGLVVAEIALALVLLIGAGLLFRAFLSLRDVPFGFAVDTVLTLRMDADPTRLSIASTGDGSNTTPSRHYFREIEERLRHIPGVRAAGFTTALPLQGAGASGSFSIPGRAPEPGGRALSVALRFVTPGYFEALAIPVRKGQLFTKQQTGGVAPLVVNETFVRQYFPSEDPIGRVLNRGIIVGVVGDVRHNLASDTPPEIYSDLSATGYSAATLAVRGDLPPEALVAPVRAALRDVNPNQATYNVKSMEQVLTDSHPDLSLHLWLIGTFAGLALILGVAGIYGVISYAVAARRREFGIRLALGADSARVLRLVLIHGIRLLMCGWVLGMGGAVALTKSLRAVLYGITPTDTTTLVAVSFVLCGASVAACLVPARRAMCVDPAIVLRDD